MKSTFYDIEPIAAPRMTRADRWKKRPCVMHYNAFKQEVRLKRVDVVSGDKIIFWIAMPKSWSEKKKKQFYGQPHCQRPDIDNLTKALLDALYKEDSHIWKIRTEKRWGASYGIEIIRGDAE